MLYVADEGESAEGADFLADWADDHDLGDADMRMETGDIEAAIQSAAEEATPVIVGASERRLFQRLIGGSVVTDIVDDIGCSVILAEKRTERSLVERLFGSQ